MGPCCHPPSCSHARLTLRASTTASFQAQLQKVQSDATTEFRNTFFCSGLTRNIVRSLVNSRRNAKFALSLLQCGTRLNAYVPYRYLSDVLHADWAVNPQSAHRGCDTESASLGSWQGFKSFEANRSVCL